MVGVLQFFPFHPLDRVSRRQKGVVWHLPCILRRSARRSGIRTPCLRTLDTARLCHRILRIEEVRGSVRWCGEGNSTLRIVNCSSSTRAERSQGAISERQVGTRSGCRISAAIPEYIIAAVRRVFSHSWRKCKIMPLLSASSRVID